MIHYLSDLHKRMGSLTPNPKQRDCNLPPGCKDLIDVLQPQLPPSPQIRVNGQISAQLVKMIQMDGTKNGAAMSWGMSCSGDVSLAVGLDMAKTRGLDLIEIGPDNIPPICLLMDFGRYRHWASQLAMHNLGSPMDQIRKLISTHP